MPRRRRLLSRRRGLELDRPTLVLGAVAVLATGTTAAVEVARVWRKGSAPLPGETADVLGAGATATRETLAVVREGYRASPDRENAMFNMAAAFAVTLGAARGTTALIRTGAAKAVLHDVRLGDRHIHHFVPGIALALGAGGTAIAVRREHLDRWLALPFGAGAALVLDEAALLLELDDVYWAAEGALSVQLSLGALALLAFLALGVRLLRRGEESVLTDPVAELPDTG
jgi:hypothetical protein